MSTQIHNFQKYSGVCYNEQYHNEQILQRTIFINKIRMLQRTVFINKIRMIHWTRRNTIGRSITRVRMTCRAFPLWLDHHHHHLCYRL